MFMRSATALIVFLLTTSNVFAQTRPLNKDERTNVSKTLSSSLKDPESAKFRFTAANIQGSTGEICGEVNARNSYGGYTGYQPFIAMLAKNREGRLVGVFVSQGGYGTSEGQIATTMCSNKGLDPRMAK